MVYLATFCSSGLHICQYMESFSQHDDLDFDKPFKTVAYEKKSACKLKVEERNSLSDLHNSVTDLSIHHRMAEGACRNCCTIERLDLAQKLDLKLFFFFLDLLGAVCLPQSFGLGRALYDLAITSKG